VSAAQHILRRLQTDPRLAYLIGPGTQSYELLTREVADASGRDVAELRASVEKTLKTEQWPSLRDAKDTRQDLLQALQGALESMETGVTSLGVIRAARAAIAKATGGAL